MTTLREQLARAMGDAIDPHAMYEGFGMDELADAALTFLAPQPGEQLYRRCPYCDGHGRVDGSIPPKPYPPTNSVLETRDIHRCESCNGRGVVPTIVPVPDEGIAGVLAECQTRKWKTEIIAYPGFYYARITPWNLDAVGVKSDNDPLTALTQAVAKALAQVRTAADAEGE